MSLLKGDGNITSTPKLIPAPDRTFKKRVKLNFTPIPIPEMEKLTSAQLLDYDPYIRKLKETFEANPKNASEDESFKI